MRKGIALSVLILFMVITAGMCTTWTITNSDFTFSPDTIIIVYGDDVDFSLASIHSVVEVSEATWDANGNSPLASGFSLPLGGGTVSMDLLTVGTHWYVCNPHASLGMKGVIIVEEATGITESPPEVHISFYPNPAFDYITIRSGEDMVGSPYSFTDLTGKLILSGELTDQTVTVDISTFESGIYLIQLGDQRRRTFKMIKE